MFVTLVVGVSMFALAVWEDYTSRPCLSISPTKGWARQRDYRERVCPQDEKKKKKLKKEKKEKKKKKITPYH